MTFFRYHILEDGLPSRRYTRLYFATVTVLRRQVPLVSAFLIGRVPAPQLSLCILPRIVRCLVREAYCVHYHGVNLIKYQVIIVAAKNGSCLPCGKSVKTCVTSFGQLSRCDKWIQGQTSKCKQASQGSLEGPV